MKEWKADWKTDDLYTIILKIYFTLYTIKLKMCTQRFYYSSSKFSKFIQGTVSLLLLFFFVTHIQTEKISSWNGPTIHVCCCVHPLKHSLAESEKQRKKSSLAGSLVSRGITVIPLLEQWLFLPTWVRNINLHQIVQSKWKIGETQSILKRN